MQIILLLKDVVTLPYKLSCIVSVKKENKSWSSAWNVHVYKNGWLLLLPGDTVIGDDHLTRQGQWGWKRKQESEREKRKSENEKKSIISPSAGCNILSYTSHAYNHKTASMLYFERSKTKCLPLAVQICFIL